MKKVYFAQAFSKYPYPPPEQWLEHPAYQKAINAVLKLKELGYDVFSPILHTYPLDVALRQMKIPLEEFPKYVEWDLGLINGFESDGWVFVFDEDCLSFHPQAENRQYVDHTKSEGAFREYSMAKHLGCSCIELNELLQNRSICGSLKLLNPP